MFNGLSLLRRISKAVASKAWGDVATLVVSLAELVGFDKETKEVTEIIACITAGEYVKATRNLGEFLILVADRITGLQLATPEQLTAVEVCQVLGETYRSV